MLFIACAPARVSAPKISQASQDVEKYSPIHTSRVTYKGISYVIKKNDSLWKIAKEYGVSVKEIMERNRIYSPNRLRVGQKIFIPRRQQEAGARFVWPVQGEIINFFGENINNSINKGLNIKTTPDRRNVIAAAAGQVVFSSDLKGWGKTIILKHAASIYTIYANLSNVSINEGNFAKRYQNIGELASNKDGNYILHFEIRKKYIPHDPLRYLN